MIETDLVSEVVIENGGVKGLRIGRTLHPLLTGVDGVRLKCRVDDLVFKLDQSGDTGQTAIEARFSAKIQGPDRKHFVEVIHCGTAKDTRGNPWRWVAQRYVDAVAHPVMPEQRVVEAARIKLQELTDRYRLDDMGSFGKNWTILNGDLLIYDYGYSDVGERAFKKT